MKRNKFLRKKGIERDNFTCQKCHLRDKTGRLLEVHHKKPLVFEGKDDLENSITLCKDCHHYAPNNQKEFKIYMQEECTGTMTIITKALQTFNTK